MTTIVLAGLLFVVTLAILSRWRVARLARTPFQAAVARASGARDGDSMKAFDVFISYKSEDALVARHLAEQFVASGLTPWFAEYTIPIVDRPRFQDAIDRGIRASGAGLCLTSDRYFASTHCSHELSHLLMPSNCGPAGVVEVRLGPRSAAGAVPFAASLPHRTVADTLAEYGRIRGLPLNAPRAVREGHRTPYNFLVADRRVSLDVTGWEVASPGTGDAGGGDVRGPSFRRWCGSDLIWGHLMTGEQDSRVRRRLLQAGAFDDRTYYEEALAFADAFFRTRGRQRCVGVHLLFLDGWSHVALTTFGAGTWSRVYSLVFPGAGDAPDTEFAFFFFCREPFDHFCRHAYLMDELVLSLQRLAAGPLLLNRQPSRSAAEP